MYQIVKDGQIIDYADKILFIKKQENGCYGECGFEECTGFSANSIPYHLEGKPNTRMEDLETASYLVFDVSKKIMEQEARIQELEQTATEILNAKE